MTGPSWKNRLWGTISCHGLFSPSVSLLSGFLEVSSFALFHIFLYGFAYISGPKQWDQATLGRKLWYCKPKHTFHSLSHLLQQWKPNQWTNDREDPWCSVRGLESFHGFPGLTTELGSLQHHWFVFQLSQEIWLPTGLVLCWSQCCLFPFAPLTQLQPHQASQYPWAKPSLGLHSCWPLRL